MNLMILVMPRCEAGSSAVSLGILQINRGLVDNSLSNVQIKNSMRFFRLVIVPFILGSPLLLSLIC